jgi:hypothetical protein
VTIYLVARSTETSVLTRATWRHILEDVVFLRLKLFVNMVLGRLFGPKWEKMKEGWRKLHILCDVGWIGLSQDRYRWSALVIVVMNVRVP